MESSMSQNSSFMKSFMSPNDSFMNIDNQQDSIDYSNNQKANFKAGDTSIELVKIEMDDEILQIVGTDKENDKSLNNKANTHFSQKVQEENKKSKKKFKTDMYMWGKNNFGQLGIPKVLDQQDSNKLNQSNDYIDAKDLNQKFDPQTYFAPLEAALDIAVDKVYCGEEHTSILSKNGDIWMIGSNQNGQLGLKVHRGQNFKNKAESIQLNTSLNSFESFRTKQEDFQTLNSNEDKQVDGQWNKYYQPVKIKIPQSVQGGNNKIVKLACGEFHTLALTLRGIVFSWGQARYGALGHDFNLLQSKSQPSNPNLIRTNQTQANQIQMYMMGGKSHGVSSNQATMSSYQSMNFKGIDISFIDEPTQIKQLENEIVFEISAGAKHSCFATLSNKVFSCGSGLQGQLGLRSYKEQLSRQNQFKPSENQNQNQEAVTDVRLLQFMFVPDQQIQVFDHIKMKQIACGRYHTLFLTQDGQVYACGQNKVGQLGLGKLRDNDTAISSKDVNIDLINCVYQPKRIELGGLKDLRVNYISAWTNSACISIEKKLFVWGSGIFGDCDQPKYIDLQQILKQEKEILIDQVEVGGSFMVFKDTNDNVYCWGTDYYKEVKINKQSFLTKKIPRKLLSDDDNVIQISVGGSFAFAYQKWREYNEADEIKLRDEKIKKIQMDKQLKLSEKSEKHQTKKKKQPNKSTDITNREGYQQAVDSNLILDQKNQISFGSSPANIQHTADQFISGKSTPKASSFVNEIKNTKRDTEKSKQIPESPYNEINSGTSQNEIILFKPKKQNVSQESNLNKQSDRSRVKSQPAAQKSKRIIQDEPETQRNKSQVDLNELKKSNKQIPKQALINQLMQQIEYCKDYEKLSEQVKQMNIENNKLKSELFEIKNSTESRVIINQKERTESGLSGKHNRTDNLVEAFKQERMMSDQSLIISNGNISDIQNRQQFSQNNYEGGMQCKPNKSMINLPQNLLSKSFLSNSGAQNGQTFQSHTFLQDDYASKLSSDINTYSQLNYVKYKNNKLPTVQSYASEVLLQKNCFLNPQIKVESSLQNSFKQDTQKSQNLILNVETSSRQNIDSQIFLGFQHQKNSSMPIKHDLNGNQFLDHENQRQFVQTITDRSLPIFGDLYNRNSQESASMVSQPFQSCPQIVNEDQFKSIEENGNSVSSDPQFKQTLSQIRDRINKCKEKSQRIQFGEQSIQTNSIKNSGAYQYQNIQNKEFTPNLNSNEYQNNYNSQYDQNSLNQQSQKIVYSENFEKYYQLPDNYQNQFTFQSLSKVESLQKMEAPFSPKTLENQFNKLQLLQLSQNTMSPSVQNQTIQNSNLKTLLSKTNEVIENKQFFQNNNQSQFQFPQKDDAAFRGRSAEFIAREQRYQSLDNQYQQVIQMANLNQGTRPDSLKIPEISSQQFELRKYEQNHSIIKDSQRSEKDLQDKKQKLLERIEGIMKSNGINFSQKGKDASFQEQSYQKNQFNDSIMHQNLQNQQYSQGQDLGALSPYNQFSSDQISHSRKVPSQIQESTQRIEKILRKNDFNIKDRFQNIDSCSSNQAARKLDFNQKDTQDQTDQRYQYNLQGGREVDMNLQYIKDRPVHQKTVRFESEINQQKDMLDFIKKAESLQLSIASSRS